MSAEDHSKQEVESVSKKNRISASATISIIFGSSVIAIGSIYYTWFVVMNDHVLSADTNTWGVFGDFFGGVLNPIVALIALVWVIKSVELQKVELTSASKALTASSNAQLQTAEIQRLNALLYALSAELSAVQADINFTREQITILKRLEWENPRASYKRQGELPLYEESLKTSIQQRNQILELIQGLNIQANAEK